MMRRAALTISLCLLAAVGVSLVGAVLAGQPGLDEKAAPFARKLMLCFSFGAFASAAAWIHVRQLAGDCEGDWTITVIGAVMIHLAAAMALPLTSNDLFSNMAYGRLGWFGLNPYLSGPQALPEGDPFRALVSPRWLDTPIVYGPLLARLDWLAGQAGSLLGVMAVLKLAMLLSSLAVVAIAYRVCRPLPNGESAFILIAWCPLLAWEVSGQAHNDGLLVLALAASVWAGTQGRNWWTALFLALGVYAKLAAAPLLAFHLWSVARRSPLRGLAMVVLVAGLGAVLMAPYWVGLSTLTAPLQVAGGDAGRTARSFTDLAVHVVPAGAVRATYLVLWGAGLSLLVGLGLRGMRRAHNFADVAHHGLIWLMAYSLVTPWFQPWYITWLLPLAMIESDQRLQRLIGGWAGLSLAQYALPIDPVTNVAISAWVLVKLRGAGATDPSQNGRA